MTRELYFAGAFEHCAIERQKPDISSSTIERNFSTAAARSSDVICPLRSFASNAERTSVSARSRRLEVLSSQSAIEPFAIGFAHEQFHNDGGIQIHHQPRESRSSRMNSSADGPP